MPHCKRCGRPVPFTYCCHCKEKVEEQMKIWAATIYDMLDEMMPHMKAALGTQAEEAIPPLPLKVLIDAHMAIGRENRRHYFEQMKAIWEECKRPAPGEFPTEEELRSQAGDAKFHEVMDEGLRGVG